MASFKMPFGGRYITPTVDVKLLPRLIVRKRVSRFSVTEENVLLTVALSDSLT